MDNDRAMISFRSISKHFGGVRALAELSLDIHAGECHALMGENGAGKSTLGKILAGIHQPDAGRLEIDGKLQAFRSPRDALLAGIGMVHQELVFCPDLSVAENLCLGRMPRRLGMLVDRREMRRRAAEMLLGVGASMDVDRPMRSLSTAQEQLCQIAAAVATNARILVFDEPTSSLGEAESQRLFGLIESLKARGVTIIYVSHRMPEVFRLCDRMSVLRDGRFVGTVSKADTDDRELVQMMVGRAMAAKAPPSPPPTEAPVVLEVKQLRAPPMVSEATFSVRRGEIVGLAGLVGSGRSELARAIFGLDPRARGEVQVGGRRVKPGSIRSAMRAGMAMLPEDRKRQGLVLSLGGRANFSLPVLHRRYSRLGWLTRAAEGRDAARAFTRLDVRAASIDTPVLQLSGGNQQKVALAKWLGTNPRILIADEPTRGVDVAAKAAIHKLLAALAGEGMALLVISSELPELLEVCHRVLVMRQGRIVADMPRVEATQEVLLRRMTGVA